MRKDASCINILTCEHYIKCVLPEVPYRDLFDDITGNKRFLVTDEETGKAHPGYQRISARRPQLDFK